MAVGKGKVWKPRETTGAVSRLSSYAHPSYRPTRIPPIRLCVSLLSASSVSLLSTCAYDSYSLMRIPAIRLRICLLSAYALAMRCPVLAHKAASIFPLSAYARTLRASLGKVFAIDLRAVQYYPGTDGVL
eukprot:3941342-Rhodomonas_salina.5